MKTESAQDFLKNKIAPHTYTSHIEASQKDLDWQLHQLSPPRTEHPISPYQPRVPLRPRNTRPEFPTPPSLVQLNPPSPRPSVATRPLPTRTESCNAAPSGHVLPRRGADLYPARRGRRLGHGARRRDER